MRKASNQADKETKKMNSAESILREGALFLVALLGSMLGYISRTWGMSKAIKYSRLGFSALAAIFMLLILRALCSALGLSYEWTVVIVGFFSWVGTEVTITFLEKIIHRHLGITHVYIQTNPDCPSGNCSIDSGGVYTLSELQGSEGKGEGARESASTNPEAGRS